MIKLGIGIRTFNRKQNLIDLIQSIENNTSMPYTQFFALDGGTDDTDDMLKTYNQEYTYGPNVGPEQNKNRIFRRFTQYDYIIMIDDDMVITNSKWLDTLLLAHTLTKYEFIGFTPSADEKYTALDDEAFGNITVSFINRYMPKVCLYTRKVIEKVGGIDERISGYLPFVSEHYIRMSHIGLVPPINTGYINLKSLDNMIIENPSKIKIDKTYNTSIEKIVEQVKRDRNIFRKL